MTPPNSRPQHSRNRRHCVERLSRYDGGITRQKMVPMYDRLSAFQQLQVKFEKEVEGDIGDVSLSLTLTHSSK